MEEVKKEIEYLEKVYGENTLKKMIEDWKKECLEDHLEDFIKEKIIEQYEYLINLRPENEKGGKSET